MSRSGPTIVIECSAAESDADRAEALEGIIKVEPVGERQPGVSTIATSPQRTTFI